MVRADLFLFKPLWVVGRLVIFEGCWELVVSSLIGWSHPLCWCFGHVCGHLCYFWLLVGHVKIIGCVVVIHEKPTMSHWHPRNDRLSLLVSKTACVLFLCSHTGIHCILRSSLPKPASAKWPPFFARFKNGMSSLLVFPHGNSSHSS